MNKTSFGDICTSLEKPHHYIIDKKLRTVCSFDTAFNGETKGNNVAATEDKETSF